MVEYLHPNASSQHPRNDSFPTSLGSGAKAYDTVLVMQFLEAYLATKDAWLKLIMFCDWRAMMFNLMKGIPEAYQPLTNRAHRLSRIARVTPSSKLSSMVLLRVTSTSR